MKKFQFQKVFTMLLVGSMGIGTFTGCTISNNNEESSVQSDKSVQESIKLNFWRAGTDVETEQYWKEFIGRFQEKYPHITVELSNIPWGDEIETKLNAAYASGTAPDILNYAIVSIPQRASVGQYMPLDEFISNWEGKDDIFPNILDLGSFEDKIYGLGMRPDARMFVWRKDMFEAAGLDPNTPPSSWEELKEYAERLTIKENGITKQGGFAMSVANGFQDFQIFLTQNGGDFIDPKTLEVKYDSPEAVEALTFLTDLVQNEIVIPTDQFQASTDAFNNGLSAMAYKNPADIRNILKENPDLEGKIGMSVPLSKVQSATFGGLGLQFISADTKHKEAAWQFVEMSMSPEEIKIRSEQLGIPVVRNSLKDEYIAKDPEMNEAILGAIEVGKGAYPVTFSNRLNEEVSRAIEKAYLGKMSPEEALKASAEAFRKEIPSLINK